MLEKKEHLLFNKVKSLCVKPAKASSLGANRVKSPSCLSRSVNSAASIRDKKILQHKVNAGFGDRNMTRTYRMLKIWLWIPTFVTTAYQWTYLNLPFSIRISYMVFSDGFSRVLVMWRAPLLPSLLPLIRQEFSMHTACRNKCQVNAKAIKRCSWNAWRQVWL